VQFSYAAAPVLNGFARLMRPVIWLLSVSTNALVRLLGGDPDKTGEELTEEELRDIVSAHQGLPEDERRILDDVLTLRGRQVSEVMRPRPEVVALEQRRARPRRGEQGARAPGTRGTRSSTSRSTTSPASCTSETSTSSRKTTTHVLSVNWPARSCTSRPPRGCSRR